VTMTPTSRSVTVNGANVSSINFTTSQQTWSISGTISGGANASVALTGAASRTVTADGAGNYSFTGLADGSYTETPTKAGVTMTPTSRAVTVNGANVGSINFTGSQQQTFSISGTITNGANATVALTGA